MKLLRNWIYPGFTLAIFLAACGPATATPVNNNPLPNVIVTVVPPVLSVACIPPVPAIGDVSSYCANQIKGVGGASFSDYTKYKSDSDNSWLVGDSISENVSCTLDQGQGIATCSGPQNGEFQATVCSVCNFSPNPDTSKNTSTCSQGYIQDSDGHCTQPIELKKAYGFCPSGSHYDNALQNCADDVTNQLASPCPPGYANYSPGKHTCWAKALGEVYNCQPFTIQLGACVAPKPVDFPITIVPFCQNKGANIGAANITIPAGYTLETDTSGDLQFQCTSEIQADGNPRYTCWGTSGGKINAGVYPFGHREISSQIEIILGTCPLQNNQENNQDPTPVPTCVHC